MNAAGRFGVGAAGNTITYTQTGGIDHGLHDRQRFGDARQLRPRDLDQFEHRDERRHHRRPARTPPPIDYRNQAGGGIAGLTGGTLQLGNAASGAAKAFNLRGVLPNLVITNTSANHTATMSTTLVNFNNISLNVTHQHRDHLQHRQHHLPDGRYDVRPTTAR